MWWRGGESVEQIRRVFEDKFRIIFHISHKNICYGYSLAILIRAAYHDLGGDTVQFAVWV